LPSIHEKIDGAEQISDGLVAGFVIAPGIFPLEDESGKYACDNGQIEAASGQHFVAFGGIVADPVELPVNQAKWARPNHIGDFTLGLVNQPSTGEGNATRKRWSGSWRMYWSRRWLGKWCAR
jgi:hypothetical protein